MILEILSSAAVTTALLGVVGYLCRDLIKTRLAAAVSHEYEAKIEKLKADLREKHDLQLERVRANLERQNLESISRIQKDLDLLKEKELTGHHDKVQIYRMVVELMSELYADLQQAFRSQQLDDALRDKYNRGWTRCYGYLSMLAPQEVMDAFDNLNDYVLKTLDGSIAPQPWAVSRDHGLKFLNAVRKDIGLEKVPVEYKGDL